MAEQDFDRSEKATPFKLQKAKEKGQVAKSTEIVSATVFFVAVLFFYWRGIDGIKELFKFDLTLLNQIGNGEAKANNFWWALESMLFYGMALLLPFFFALLLAAFISNFAQIGVVLSVEPLKPDFDRLNPVSGFKKLFSIRSLFHLFRVIVKLVLLSLISYFSLKEVIPKLFRVKIFFPLESIKIVQFDIVSLGFKIALVLGILSFIDLAYVRREFAKKMRMSKRDVKDEAKSRDGDPRIRGRLRELRREMRKRSMAVSKTKNADVLITNPTHIAVALKYEHGQMESPLLIAKGAGALAESMKKIAIRNNIPIVQNKILARKLFGEVDFERNVPTHLYADVARIMIWVFSLRKSKENASQGRVV
ncbi:EscU/YscU/HrcU family type III secretion system export apparatus switch protein [Undibacterium sp. Ji49W]|uniref:EscU/YscU/HrcU family type III secretion system export apparatus switch protein n=1 Tax=Undibacterium sp. Ji49W TaxID=3413040 RepID=UPI003BF214A7